jgi:hypothetical protein
VATVLNTELIIKGVGTSIITATQEGDCGFNEAVSVSQPFIVKKALLTITANDTMRPQYYPNPEFTLSFNGFVCGEDESVLDILPAIACSADHNSPVGTYPITLSGGSDNNYDFVLVNGLLEVTPAKWYIGDPTLEDVTATLNNGTLTITGAGNMLNFNNETAPWNFIRNLIETINIENGVNSVGNYAFYNCNNLTSVTLPNSIKSIGAYSFRGCSVKNLTIPNSVTSIGEYTFSHCQALISVNVQWQVPLPVSPNTFAGVNIANVKLNVPYGTQNEYCDAPVWQDFIIEKANFINEIPPLCEKINPPVQLGTPPIELWEMTNAGLTINYESSNPAVATVSGNILTIHKAGTVHIIGTQDGNCLTVAAKPDTCELVVNSVGIDENLTQQISIYPNPAQTEIFIKSDLQIEKVKIYSVTGSLLLSENNFNEKVSVSTLTPGFYLVHVYTEKGLIVSKMVKQ